MSMLIHCHIQVQYSLKLESKQVWVDDDYTRKRRSWFWQLAEKLDEMEERKLARNLA